MTAITRKPTARVSSHAYPSRDGNTFKSSWKVPSDATKDSNRRATNTFISWDIFTVNGKSKIKLTKVLGYYGTGTTATSCNINNFKTTGASVKKYKNVTLTRNSFYPYTNLKVTSIVANAVLTNGCGWGPISAKETKMYAPAAPKVDAFAFDVETGTVSVKVTAAENKPNAERKRTKYTWKVQYKKNGKSTVVHKNETNYFDGGEKTFYHDCTAYQALKNGEYYIITLTVWSMGLAGASAAVTRRFVVAPPATVTLGNPQITTGSNGQVYAPITIAHKYTTKTVTKGNKKVQENDLCIDPVSGVILEAAVNVSASKESLIPADSWEEVGAVDDGECCGLTANTADLVPQENNYTWIRVKSWRFDKDTSPLTRYSNVKSLSALRTVDTATDDECAILELAPTADGTGARVLIGYDKKDGSTRDDADGTELSWSEDPNAWLSTKQPDTFEVEWRDATSAASEGDPGYLYRNNWYYTQTVYVEGLDEGIEYNFRVRRYNEDSNGVKTYGNYDGHIWGTKTSNPTEAAKCTPVVRPTAVILGHPASVAVGSSIRLTWTFDGGEQTAYRVLLGGGNKVVAESTGSTASCVLRHDAYKDFVSDGVLQARVQVCTSRRGDDFVSSQWETIAISERPTCEMSISTVTSQPLTATIYSSTGSLTASITVRSQGAGGCEECGVADQIAGDDVWGATVEPSWTQTTWGETSWYDDNVGTAEDAAEDAYDALDIATETFTGLVDALRVSVEVEEDETRPYALVQLTDEVGPYMEATMTAGADSWVVSNEPVMADSTGTEDEDGTYLRLPIPQAMQDALAADDPTDLFDGCTVSVSYLAASAENEEAWADYMELVAAASALTADHPSTGTVWTTTVQAPDGLDLRDGATYDASCVVTSTTSGLASNEAACTFDVLWSHQAPVPSDSILVTPYDTTDANGIREIGAEIDLASPTGYVSGDSYDVWRVANDGAQLIAVAKEVTDEVVDPYAPFGDADLYYRVVTRTADGDFDYKDYPYSLAAKITRLDFGDEYVELPYNLVLKHDYSKDSEQRQHLGEELPQGYWNRGHGRTLDIESEMIRVLSAEDRAKLHRLGQHAGPVFVRTHDGSCMEAEVVPSISLNYSSAAVPVSLTCTEIALTEEHMERAED